MQTASHSIIREPLTVSRGQIEPTDASVVGKANVAQQVMSRNTTTTQNAHEQQITEWRERVHLSKLYDVYALEDCRMVCGKFVYPPT